MAETPDKMELAERLGLMWLQRMEKMMGDGSITSTDMATLARVLLQNGWSLDPKQLPKGLRDKMTRHVDPTKFADDDADVIGKINAG